MKPITWDNITSWDVIIHERYRKLIKEIERFAERRCPHLKKSGNFSIIVEKTFEKNVDENELSPSNPIYWRMADTMLLQMHCMEKYETCCVFTSKLPWKDLQFKNVF